MKVLVRHLREVLDTTTGNVEFYTKQQYRNALKEGKALALCQQGGYTEALALDSEGHVIAKGRAECSDRDMFNRRVGRDVAMGRLKIAIDKLPKL